MIELDLGKVLDSLMWELKVLAAIRCVCVANQIDVVWCVERERGTARLIGSVRRVISARGGVMQIREKG